MKKREYEVLAAVNLGSSYIDMNIVQIKKNGEVETIETLSHPTRLGVDSLKNGRIGINTMKECLEVLKSYKKIINTYGIKRIEAVSTSGMREAENREYVIDQIKVKTGIKVNIVSMAEERFFIYKALGKSNLNLDRSKNTLVVTMSYGGLEISMYEQGKLKFTEYLKLGSLKTNEILSSVEYIGLNYMNMMKDYFESKINSLYVSIGKKNIENLIALGGEVKKILKILSEEKEAEKDYQSIDKKKIKELYEKISLMSIEQIAYEYDIPKREAETLIPSVTIIYALLGFTNTKRVTVPGISTVDGIMETLLEESPYYAKSDINSTYDDIISSVWFIAEKYGVSKPHAQHVSDLAVSLFDQLAKVHNLDRKYRLLLKTAAILHDCGNYVSLSDHASHSYSIIKSQNIMGFSNKDLEIVGNIAKYHSGKVPKHSDASYSKLDESEKVIVSKLASLLSISEVIDIGHSKKIKSISIRIVKEDIVFTIKSDKQMTLEIWELEKRMKLFEEVYGMKTYIKAEKGIG